MVQTNYKFKKFILSKKIQPSKCCQNELFYYWLTNANENIQRGQLSVSLGLQRMTRDPTIIHYDYLLIIKNLMQILNQERSNKKKEDF